MATPVRTQLSIGSREILHFTNLVIQQSLFGHHQFSVEIPFDVLEGSQRGFLSGAHRDLVAQPLTVSIRPAFPSADKAKKQAASFAFKGIVTHLEMGTQGDLTGSFTVQGFSPTCILADVTHFRTFRKKTLADIFRTVLGSPYPSNDLANQLKPAHRQPVPYVAQYGESDFTFLHRLAAQHGEWLYYDGTTLRLGRPSGPDLPFEADGIRAGCRLRLGVQATAFAVAQYEPGRHQVLRAESAAQSVSWVGQNPLTAFAEQASNQLFVGTGTQRPQLVLEDQAALNQYTARVKSQQATRLLTCSGWGDDPDMTLCRVLDITGKGLGTQAKGEESFGKYLLTTVTHVVDSGAMYSNVFEALPWSAEHPPLNPHVHPPVGHPELAEVIDLQDPARLGRLRLRYQWKVARPQDAETDWVRATTPYSGDGKGQLFSPEVGSQVLVGYEQNRAEQPLVLGNLVHGQNKQGTKYSNEGNHLKGIQTAGGNKVVMSDKKGQQTILLSNSSNKGTAVEVGFKGDGSITIKSNGPVTVLSPNITLEAGEKGELKMHAKNITIVAEDDIKVSAKKQGISLDAKQKMAFTSKELLAVGSQKATLQSATELALNGGSKATLQSGDTKVH